jgi:WD40 repeat protein
MARRRLLIERPAHGSSQAPVALWVEVSDDQLIEPLVSTVAARFGYPLVDSFGAPIRYRLRLLPAGTLLPATGQMNQVHRRSGHRFVLEAEGAINATIPLPQETNGTPAPQRKSPFQMRLSRRTLLTAASTLSLVSVLGLTLGMTTALAQKTLSTFLSSVPLPAGPRRSAGPLQLALQNTFTGHQQTVHALTWSPDGKTLASGDDGRVLLWRPDGIILHVLPFARPVRALAWSPDSSQLAVGSGRTTAFVDSSTATLLAENSQAHRALVTALGWTQTTPALCVSAGEDTRAVVWDDQIHQPRSIFQQHTAPLLALATFFDVVSTASEGGIVRLWNAFSGEVLHGYFDAVGQPIRALSFASTGMLAIGSDDGVVRVWKDGRSCVQQAPSAFGLRCLDTPMSLRAHRGPAHAVAFSPDGALLATGGDDGRVILWQGASLTPILTHTLPGAIAALSWSPSGSFLAIAAGSFVTLWQLHH